MLVIPATLEAEAGELLEYGGGGCSEPRLQHCTPVWGTRGDSISKKKNNTQKCYPAWGNIMRLYLYKKYRYELGMVAHAYSPSYLGG